MQTFSLIEFAFDFILKMIIINLNNIFYIKKKLFIKK